MCVCVCVFVCGVCECVCLCLLLKIFFGVPHLATCIFFYNEHALGAEINPGMALTPLPSSIGQGSNPQPSDRELSALPLDHSFHSMCVFGCVFACVFTCVWVCV